MNTKLAVVTVTLIQTLHNNYYELHALYNTPGIAWYCVSDDGQESGSEKRHFSILRVVSWLWLFEDHTHSAFTLQIDLHGIDLFQSGSIQCIRLHCA